MSARLIILVVVAAGMAVWLATKPATVKSTESVPGEDVISLSNARGDDINTIRLTQTPLWKRELAGEEPPDKPDVSITHEVDTSTGKNRIYLYLTEAHGYYVESFDIDLWYTGGEEIDEPDDADLSFNFKCNNFIPANGTLETCVEVVPAELAKIGDDIGTTKDWAVRVKTPSYSRARVNSPDPLPLLADLITCQ